jgi:hypothetical protein
MRARRCSHQRIPEAGHRQRRLTTARRHRGQGWRQHEGLTQAILDAENLRCEAGRNILFVHGMNVGWIGCGPHLFQRELL